MTQTKILLTQQEQRIFAIILEVSRKMNTTARVCGGWVRDRIIGKQSDDIDIALSSITGKKFEVALRQYGVSHPEASIGKSYVIAENIEKSKHLETIAIEIEGIKIEFVNLRSEEYGDSRIPTMTIGTPQQDAERRDLTINALFFNIATGEVEDYVGGLKDLETMTLRTPLNAKKTFLDDPLRVLRAVRFFSKFADATLSQDILDAMSLTEVQEAFKNKVSAERASPEILKMLDGKRPVEAFRRIFETGFDKALFATDMMNGVDLRVEQKNRHHRFTILEHTLRVMENVDALMKDESPQTRGRMLLAALFHDFGKAVPGIAKPKTSDPNQMTYKGHEDESAKIAEEYLKAIGVPKEDRDFINKVVLMHMRVHADSWSKRSIGKFIKESEIAGQENVPVWRYVHLHGIADAQAKGTGDPEAETARKFVFLKQFEDFRVSLGKDNSPKPILNGFDLMQLFSSLKPSKTVVFKCEDKEFRKNFIVFISDKLLDEQAEGRVCDKEQAEAFVQTVRAEVESIYL